MNSRHALTAVLAIVVISAVCLFRNAPRIESDIAARAGAALTGAGLAVDDMSVSGREVALAGALVAPGAIDRAREALSHVRGIRTVTIKSPPTQTANTTPESVSVPSLDEPSRSSLERAIVDAIAGREVRFQSSSAELTPEGRSVLDDVVALLQQHPGVRIRVIGHTDASGDAQMNLDLSVRRAEAARQYLIDRGLPAERLSATGFGETQPLADNATPAGRRANRRIEFRVQPEG